MTQPVSRPKRGKTLAEDGLLIVVIGGTFFAVVTQQFAWGLVPSAIALVVNRFHRKQQQRSQQDQFNYLELSQLQSSLNTE